MQADDGAVVRAEGFGGVEEAAEAGAGEAGAEGVGGVGVFAYD